LDKAYGQISREVALGIVEGTGGEVVCPVLLNNIPTRYEKILVDLPLLVVDGCQTRCATKLANKLGVKIDQKLLVSDAAKEAETPLDKSPRLAHVALKLAEEIVASFQAGFDKKATIADPSAEFDAPVDFTTFSHDKYVFKIPVEGYLFNENDCWARVVGRRARVGISDYMQQNLTDITYFEPPIVGRVIEQFDELGTVESAKAATSPISPVSGKIVAVNSGLVNAPGAINEDPYGKGWIAEIELGDFESEKELLLESRAYSEHLKKKVAEL
jgi:glycine cleavage system H protein